MKVFMENDILEDDLEIFEIINHGFPREVFERDNHFYTMDQLSFFKRFRLMQQNTTNKIIKLEFFY